MKNSPLPPLSHCHMGNTPLLTSPAGWQLLIAGTSHLPDFSLPHLLVMDLTSHFHLPITSNDPAFIPPPLPGQVKILSMPVKDYSIPTWGSEVWPWLINLTWQHLTHAGNVLVLCTGGHGRSGMIAAILAFHLSQKMGVFIPDPVQWIRSKHCSHAIETIPQENYVYQKCNLPLPLEKLFLQPLPPAPKNTKNEPFCEFCQGNYDDHCSMCNAPLCSFCDEGICDACLNRYKKYFDEKE